MKRILLAAIMLVPQWALAEEETPCAPIEAVSAGLAKQFGEVPAFIGADGAVAITVYLNAATGTFTVMAVKETGMACELIDGEHWRALKIKPVEPGNPS